MAVEPRVEDLLAAIRRAIDNDISQLDQADSHKMAGCGLSVGAVVKRGDQDLATLRNRVIRQSTSQLISESSHTEQEQRPRLPDLLRPSYIDDDLPKEQVHHGPQAYEPVPEEAQWQPEPLPQAHMSHVPVAQVYEPQPAYNGALMSPQAALTTHTSFQALADTMMANLGGDRQLQDMARDLLRPLLKQWLDVNLPPLVETLVREEINRVARRGR